MRRAVVLLAVAACSSDAASSGPAPAPSKPRDARGADADLAKLDGAGVFQVLCAPCHGADAKGYKADHAPSLVNPTFLESASDEFVAASIAMGRPGTSMAAYAKAAGGPLEDRQIAELLAWVRGHGGQAKPLPAVAAGDAQRGAPLYAANCQKCHGTQTTRGDSVHLANQRFLGIATDAFVRWAIVHGRPGTPMEAWQPKLSDRDVDDLVAYVRAFAKDTGLPAEGKLPAPTGKEPLVVNPRGGDPVFKLTADTGSDDKRYVSAEQVKQALDAKKKIIIIDARPASEWMRVHITGAVSIPHHDLKRLDEMPKDGTWAVAYCACPHHLSGIVVDELRKRGYAHSAVIDEGILEWHRRGYPVVAATGVQPPPKEGSGAR